MITTSTTILDIDDMRALLEAEDALRLHLPADGVAGLDALFDLFGRCHAAVIAAEPRPLAAPACEPALSVSIISRRQVGGVQ